ncbi:DUF2065 domain-containing protein [Candidatus Berkiella cookevillensis]|uniref:DUF2065 domain-containing protein n=1 Tax=Candidatus Berkiella cookevillensis TaxID=437022 RepID=A0A0Q9YU65_9GAMM|nr:DUF2065 domain-containing protein [Candidatus Berkiella cookevillensis]MCS5707557.1 DUF2065 domain-containing protein [Candidatus Berkiella cookevillensis]
MWEDLFVACALVLVIEGLMPFISPVKWRTFMLRVSEQPDKALRIMGLVSMLSGVLLLFLIRSFD